MTNLYFEELEIGTRSAAGPYIVSKDEIIQFAKQYDPVPRHIDEQAAARSVFGGLTASGSHTFADHRRQHMAASPRQSRRSG